MSTSVFSEDAIAAHLGLTRKVLALQRRKKTADGQWTATCGEVHYSELGLQDLLVSLEFATRTLADGFRVREGLDYAILLEKTRRAPASAPPDPAKKTPAPAAAPLRVRVLRQYPNRHFWRVVNLDTGLALDLYEPKRPWVLSPRKVVHVEPVPGKPYFKITKPAPLT